MASSTTDIKDTRVPDSITRREVIRRALALSGAATLVGTGTLLTACAATTPRKRASATTDFTTTKIQWLDEVAETILPQTDTPGAKAAEVGAFIALMVTDTYSPQEQSIFKTGLQTLEAECEREHSVGFMLAAPTERQLLLERLDQAQFDYTNSQPPSAPPHYFRMIKELTVLGYFTSEIGYTQALRYVESPGRFDACLDYRAGERTWARHA